MVEIIPRKTEESPRWQIALFYFSVFVLVGAIICYSALFYLQKKSEENITNLDQKISDGQTQERLALEKEILEWQKEFKDFSSLLEQHISNIGFFGFLEQKTHSKVFFPKINLNSKDSSVVFSGEADSFLILGQQLLIFEKEAMIKELNVSNVSLNKEGKIEFSLDAVLNPQIFKYSPPL